MPSKQKSHHRSFNTKLLKHHRSITGLVFDPVSYETIEITPHVDQHSKSSPTPKTSLYPNTIDIHGTWKRRYVVITANIIRMIIDYFQSGRYKVLKNPYRNLSQRAQRALIHSSKKRYDLHTYSISIMMDFDLHYGPTIDHIQRLQSVDIMGLTDPRNNDLNILRLNPIINAWIYRELAIANKSHHICVTPICPHVVLKGSILPGYPFPCPECKTIQCVGCESDWSHHEGLTCSQFQTSTQLSHSLENCNCEHTLNGLLDGSIQPCPNCGIMTERLDGCNKMICLNHTCRNNWCWACGLADLKYKYNNKPYRHYRPHTTRDQLLGRHQCPSSINSTKDLSYYGVATSSIILRNKRMFARRLHKYQQEKNKLSNHLSDKDTKISSILFERLERLKHCQSHMQDLKKARDKISYKLYDDANAPSVTSNIHLMYQLHTDLHANYQASRFCNFEINNLESEIKILQQKN